MIIGIIYELICEIAYDGTLNLTKKGLPPGAEEDSHVKARLANDLIIATT